MTKKELGKIKKEALRLDWELTFGGKTKGAWHLSKHTRQTDRRAGEIDHRLFVAAAFRKKFSGSFYAL